MHLFFCFEMLKSNLAVRNCHMDTTRLMFIVTLTS